MNSQCTYLKRVSSYLHPTASTLVIYWLLYASHNNGEVCFWGASVNEIALKLVAGCVLEDQEDWFLIDPHPFMLHVKMTQWVLKGHEVHQFSLPIYSIIEM